MAVASNSMDKLCVYLITMWSGGRCRDLIDVYARALTNLVNVTTRVSNPHDYVNHMFKRP
jgi:hypothetical protein